jgi:hypothetical protein
MDFDDKPLIFLGDIYQLPPVREKNVFASTWRLLWCG